MTVEVETMKKKGDIYEYTNVLEVIWGTDLVTIVCKDIKIRYPIVNICCLTEHDD